ncbi:MAG: hypothetical protein CMJ19_25110 [Phycisphaeraceae bacterium]|nr:hypothetical protein [Phycisphaeraceae bacterium]
MTRCVQGSFSHQARKVAKKNAFFMARRLGFLSEAGVRLVFTQVLIEPIYLYDCVAKWSWTKMLNSGMTMFESLLLSVSQTPQSKLSCPDYGK